MISPLVGVVIPTRNGERHLAAALDSVLAQTHPELDVVVADDGSSDATREVAAGYSPEVRLLDLPRGGLGGTRNAGVEAVAGEHVALLRQDGPWGAAKLEPEPHAAQQAPSPDLGFGH